MGETIYHPTYQKSCFDMLAFGRQTDFRSRTYSTTNCDSHAMEIITYLKSLGKNEVAFRSLLLDLPLSFDLDERFLKSSFRIFTKSVMLINIEDSSLANRAILNLNNSVVRALGSGGNSRNGFKVVVETMSRSFDTSLGILKFRNLDTGEFAVQDRGWDSITSDSNRNLILIVLRLFKPIISSIDEFSGEDIVIGNNRPIPNDYVLDLSVFSDVEVYSSLFSIEMPDSVDVSRDVANNNVGAINVNNGVVKTKTKVKNRSKQNSPDASQNRVYSTHRVVNVYFKRMLRPIAVEFRYI